MEQTVRTHLVFPLACVMEIRSSLSAMWREQDVDDPRTCRPTMVTSRCFAKNNPLSQLRMPVKMDVIALAPVGRGR
jgi:hypothetical protein